MTPFDPPPANIENFPETKGSRETGRAPKPAKNITRISNDELPPCWQGASPAELLLYGPESAKFAEPPPANAIPPEPPEQVGDALTERQLAFCERYVECPVATRAAREAGYAAKTAAHQASRLLKHPLIMQRILELRRKRHLEQAYRRETLMDKFEAVFAEAIEGKDYYAAIQALTMQARLAGLNEAMPGLRYLAAKTGREQTIWDAVNRLEQKLTEIAAGAYPGAAAAAGQD